MSPQLGFTGFLLLTVLLLAAVVFTGRRARRRLHLTLVLCTVLSLAAAVFWALELGQLYDLEAAGWITPFHLRLARVCTAAYLLPLITGILTIRRPERVVWHRRAAFLVVGLTLASAVTGVWMILAAPALD